MDRVSRAKLLENGMNVSTVNKKFRNELDAIGTKLRSTWAKKAGAEATKILDQYDKITGRR